MNTDIVQVIRAYGIELKRAGREYIGLCPFHGEKTPSFHVNAHKGVFHCFGCGEGGDTAAFIMKYTGCNFKTAVSVLKNDFNMSNESICLSNTNAKIKRERRQKQNDTINTYYYILCDVFRGMYKYIHHGGAFDSTWVYAVNNIDRAEWYLDELEFRPDEFFRNLNDKEGLKLAREWYGIRYNADTNLKLHIG